MIALAFLALSCITSPIQDDGADWMTYNRNFPGDRYSPLKEFDQDSVKQLRQIAHFDLGSKTNFQSGPIAIDGTVYLSTVTHTYAVDGATGKMKWKHVHSMSKPGGTGAHRGVAYMDGKIFRGFNDGVVAAIDAQTGKVLWATVIGNPKVGESLPMAPIAYDGKVFIGNAGGDMYGVTGRIYALDANNGHQVWMFNCVPKSGPAISTWPMRNRIPPSGAATWTSFSLDTEKGILYVPAGNPAPDFAPEVRKGQNLYANCVVALDTSTGKLIDYIQPVKNDYHDWDVASAPALIRSKSGRSMAIIAPKDGLVYGVDRSGVGQSASAKGMVIRYRTPVTTRFNVNKKFTAKSFTRFAPGVEGGVEWNGPAYDPATNTIFTHSIDWPHSVKRGPTADLFNMKPGMPFTGTHDGGFGKKDPFSTARGWITALDADSGRIKWQYRAPTPLVAGVTPTAGGIVFGADLKGNVYARSIRGGQLLWNHASGYPVGGGVITYMAGGKQYLAVAAGINSPSWGGKKPSRLLIYSLP